MSASSMISALLNACVMFCSIGALAQQPSSPNLETSPYVADAFDAPTEVMPDKATLEGGVARAFAGERELWSATLIAPPYVQGLKTVGPTLLGAYAFACVRNQLYRLSATTGHVSGRAAMPGDCDSFEVSQGTLIVKVKAPNQLSTKAWTSQLTADDALFDAPPLELNYPMGRMMVRRLASLSSHIKDLPERQDGERRQDFIKRAFSSPPAPLAAQLQEMVGWLEVQEQRDPTNPWYRFERAQALSYLGQPERAKPLYESLAQWSGQGKDELMAMVIALDEIDADLAQRVFELSLRDMMQRGYNPELGVSLISLVVIYGRWPQQVSVEALIEDSALYATLTRHADRLAMYSPRGEAIYYFWQAMADAATARKEPARAKRYAALADKSFDYRILGFADKIVGDVGNQLNLFLGTLWAILLLVVLKLLRTFSARYDRTASPLLRFNPLTRWSYMEVVGLLCLVPLLMFTGQRVAQGVKIVGLAAGAPYELFSGDLGHPAAAAYINEVDATVQAPGYTSRAWLLADYNIYFVQAFSAQQAGDLERAATLYEKIGRPWSINNLGVIRAAQGRPDEAKALWEKALNLDPNLLEAAHNLGQTLEPTSVKAERLSRYAQGLKVNVAPNSSHWASIWLARALMSGVAAASSFEGMGALQQLFAVAGDEPGMATMTLPNALSIALIFALLGFGLLALATPRRDHKPSAPKLGWPAWALSLLLPGASKQYGVFGPIVTVIFITAAICAETMGSSGGQFTSVLDAIAVPSYGRIFGVISSGATPDTPFHLLGKALWLIFGAHIVFIALMEWRSPDDAGLVARFRQKRQGKSA